MEQSDFRSVEDLATEPDREQSNPPHHILVVDDDPDGRQLSVDLLVDAGYEVAAVADGAAGWEMLQTNSYDLVITDNQMPRMTGLEMIEKLRDARLSLPVIMATRSLPLQEFERKPWLKPDATLERPCSNYDFLLTVKRLLRIEDSYRAHMNMLLPSYLQKRKSG